MLPVFPGRPLVLGLAIPVVLAFAALLERAVLPLMLAADAVILLMALIDLAFVLRPEISVRRSHPEILSLARPVTVELEVQSRAKRALAVAIQEDLFDQSEAEGLPLSLTLAPGVVRRVEYRLRAMQRGPQVLGDHFVRYPSPMGFWIRQLRLAARSAVKVYPDVIAVRHYELLARQNRDTFASRAARQRGGDTEFERLRDYLPDDEFRRIDWKATARRRRFTVREYQLEKNQNVMFLVDCGRTMTALWDGLTALDHALNAVLMLSHVAIRRGDQVGLIAFGEDVTRVVRPRGGVSASNRIIQATYDLFPQMVEPNYEAAFQTLRRQVQKRTLVILLSHTLDEVTQARIQRQSRELLPRHLPLCVLLRDREVEARAHTAATDPEGLAVQAAAAELLLFRSRAVSEMQRAGVLVLDVLHRQLTGSLVSRYLEIKARGLI